MTETKTPYAQLLVEIAKRPVEPDSCANSPVSEAYNTSLAQLRDDLERSFADAEGVIVFCDPDRVVLADGSKP